MTKTDKRVMTLSNGKKMYDFDTVAERFNVTKRTVQIWASKKHIPRRMIAGRFWLTAAEIKEIEEYGIGEPIPSMKKR